MLHAHPSRTPVRDVGPRAPPARPERCRLLAGVVSRGQPRTAIPGGRAAHASVTRRPSECSLRGSAVSVAVGSPSTSATPAAAPSAVAWLLLHLRGFSTRTPAIRHHGESRAGPPGWQCKTRPEAAIPYTEVKEVKKNRLFPPGVAQRSGERAKKGAPWYFRFWVPHPHPHRTAPRVRPGGRESRPCCLCGLHQHRGAVGRWRGGPGDLGLPRAGPRARPGRHVTALSRLWAAVPAGAGLGRGPAPTRWPSSLARAPWLPGRGGAARRGRLR